MRKCVPLLDQNKMTPVSNDAFLLDRITRGGSNQKHLTDGFVKYAALTMTAMRSSTRRNETRNKAKLHHRVMEK